MDNHNIPMIVDPAVSCLGVGNDVKEEDAKNTSRRLDYLFVYGTFQKDDIYMKGLKSFNFPWKED